jgi:hypothetical protein
VLRHGVGQEAALLVVSPGEGGLHLALHITHGVGPVGPLGHLKQSIKILSITIVENMLQ